MHTLLYGDHIARDAQLHIGCFGVVYNRERDAILLAQRGDIGKWALPGGALEAGESLPEACAREMQEELGIQVEVGALIGVYSSPHRVLVSSSGKRRQLLAFVFEARIIAGAPQLTPESSAFAYVGLDDLSRYDVSELHLERIRDVLSAETFPVIR